MFERFTAEARQVVVGAQEQARALNHNYIGTEHVLLGLTALPPEVGVGRALHALGLTTRCVRARVEGIVGRGDDVRQSGHIPFTPRAKKVLELSLREALRLKSHEIGPEHVVLGLLREGGGVAVQVITQHGVDLDVLRAAMLAQAPASGPVGPPATARTPAAEHVLALAERLAAGAPVGSHHLLEAMVRTEGSMAEAALAALGVDADTVAGRVDEMDIGATTDVTPEQAAAARMQLLLIGIRPEGERSGEPGPGAPADPGGPVDPAAEIHVAVVTSDPATVERVRRIVEQAGGRLGGDGPLAGPFVTLHQAIQLACGHFEAALAQPGPDAEAGGRGEPRISLRDRLRRRRPAG